MPLQYTAHFFERIDFLRLFVRVYRGGALFTCGGFPFPAGLEVFACADFVRERWNVTVSTF
jgi:hypothetical protein